MFSRRSDLGGLLQARHTKLLVPEIARRLSSSLATTMFGRGNEIAARQYRQSIPLYLKPASRRGAAMGIHAAIIVSHRVSFEFADPLPVATSLGRYELHSW